MDSLSAACGLILCGAEQGTGYLVSPTRMVTCCHVVGKEKSATVKIAGQEVPATVVETDEASDCAVLELSKPLDGAPLRIASGPVHGEWTSFGFPGIARGIGLPLVGTVLQANGLDVNQQPAMVLYSDQVAAGMAVPVSGFSGSPVVAGNMVIGHLKRILAEKDKPTRPVLGLLFATQAAAIRRILGLPAEDKPTPVPPSAGERQARDAERAVQTLLNEVKAAVTAERVFRLWNRLQRTSIGDNRIAECAADRLISLGRPDYALEVIGATGESVRARQLKGNALAKTGRVEDAIEVLRQLEAEAPGDPETRGMLAARYRQMWESTGERSWLIEARETYKLCFDLTGSTYCGINAASLALMDGKTPEALRIAGQLISKLEVVDEASRDRWYYATAGEAYLILNDLASAREAYRKAAGKAAGLYQDIAVMRQGVRRTCKAVGQPESSLDDILTTPAVFAFFGHSVDAPTREKPPRFPKGQVGRVSADIRAVLDQYRVHFGVSSACSGGDLLFLGELLKRGGQVTIVLPMEPEEFRETFLFGSWAERFDKILPSAVVRIAQPRTHEDVWDACRREIRDAACDIAGPLQEPAQLLVLWDGDSKNYVRRAIDYWEELGDPVVKIMLGQADSARA